MATILKHPFDDECHYQHIAERLAIACRSVLASVLLDPHVAVGDIQVKYACVPRFDSRDGYPQFFVTVATNDASMLRGAVGFKGSYKERVEGTLNYLVDSWMAGSRAYVEILGPESESVERLIPLSTMISNGRLSSASPIALCAEDYRIPYIQIRGRHLIGPNPALAVFLRDFALRNPDGCRTVMDMFGGTGITAKVICSHGSPRVVTLVDNDPQKTANMRKHIRASNVEIIDADANQIPIAESYDLVIADPYYEDVLSFLAHRLSTISECARVFVFIPGNVEHGTWNQGVSERIESAGFVVTWHQLFGQIILEAHNLRSWLPRS